MLLQSGRIILLLLSTCLFYKSVSAQVADTTSTGIPVPNNVNYNKDSATVKDKHFKTAGKALANVVLSVPGDFYEMGKEVTSKWQRTVAYSAGVGLLILADKPITRFHQDVVEKHINYSLPWPPRVKIFKNINLIGGTDLYLAYPLGALYFGSVAANYKTGQRAALNSFKAMTYSYVITQVILKTIFARQRPDLTLSNPNDPIAREFSRNPYDFFNFHPIRLEGGGYGTSFPSFHATAYYAIAKVLAMEFHNYWIPYTAVTFVFFTDLKSHQHWVSDMVAGGLLGTIIGHGVVMGTRRLEKRRSEKKQQLTYKSKPKFDYKIIPSISNRGVGLNFYAFF